VEFGVLHQITPRVSRLNLSQNITIHRIPAGATVFFQDGWCTQRRARGDEGHLPFKKTEKMMINQWIWDTMGYPWDTHGIPMGYPGDIQFFRHTQICE